MNLHFIKTHGVSIFIILLSQVVFAPGQTRVENPKQPLAKNAGRFVDQEEMLRIRDGAKTAIFRTPRHLALGRDGSLYFLDFAEGSASIKLKNSPDPRKPRPAEQEEDHMNGRTNLPLVLLACAFVCAGSSAVDKTPEDKPAYQRADDFAVISNPKTPKNPSLRIVFKEDLTIGVKEGDENYMFGRLWYFNVDDKGNIYVVDWDKKWIQKYGPDGKYLLTIGRYGQGPGEFGNVWMPHFDRNGNLYVRDNTNHKVAFFDPEGKLLKEIKMPIKAGEVQVNSRGEYVSYIDDQQVESEGRLKIVYRHGLFDKDFSPLAVFQQTTWTSAPLSGRDQESLAKFLADSMSNGALGPSVTLFLGLDDKIYVGYPEVYEIRVYSPEGKPDRLIRKDHPPQAVTEMHKKDYSARQDRDFLSTLPAVYSESIRRKALSLIRYPKYLPAYQTFTLMDNGWLAVVVDSIEGGPAKIDFFDEHGVYIAEGSAEISVEGLKFKKDKAYAITTTEDGYRFVKRYSFEMKEDQAKRSSGKRRIQVASWQMGR